MKTIHNIKLQITNIILQFFSYKEPYPSAMLGKFWYHFKWFILGIVLGFLFGAIFL